MILDKRKAFSSPSRRIEVACISKLDSRCHNYLGTFVDSLSENHEDFVLQSARYCGGSCVIV